jgi:hypothetical protein
MTPDQLSAIRERLDAAMQGPSGVLALMVSTDLRALLAEIDRLKTALDEKEADMHLRIRQGYDKTVADSWRSHCARIEQERDAARVQVERLTDDLALARQVSGELCEACGWAMKFPGEPCRCELLKEVERLNADRDTAFARGAEAMRDALLQRVSWGSDLADRIRAEPVPEDK